MNKFSTISSFLVLLLSFSQKLTLVSKTMIFSSYKSHSTYYLSCFITLENLIITYRDISIFRKHCIISSSNITKIALDCPYLYTNYSTYHILATFHLRKSLSLTISQKSFITYGKTLHHQIYVVLFSYFLII